MESSMCGLLAGYFVWCKLQDKTPQIPDKTTVCGALLDYITTENKDFQPMGANMGILPPLPERIKDKKLRYRTIADRGLEALKKALCEQGVIKE